MNKARVAVLVVLLLLVSPAFAFAHGATTASLNAASLSLSVTPSELPADGLSYGAVTVSLVTSASAPSLASTNTTVYLSVSQNNVGTLPSSVVIAAGQSFVIANFTTTTTPGQTTITASSPGLTSASASLETAIPSGFPSHIQLFATPSTLLASPSGQPSNQGSIVVELTDDQGLPAKAPSAVTIQLSSSDTSVVTLAQNQVTIPANQSLTIGNFTTSFTPGTPTITAFASGYPKGSVSITVEGPAPLKLTATVEPSQLSTSSSGLLMIALTDESGNPARAPSPILVTLRSSNTSIATVPDSVTIPAGSIYTWVNFSSSAVPGTATITATSQGLDASSSVVTTFAPSTPTALKIFANPNPVLADDSQYANAVVIELVGANSQPAVASGSGYNISLASSSSAIGSVPSSIVIPAGQSYTVSYFQSTYASGSTTVTASATNLLPASVSMSTYGPVPYQISLSVYGSSASSGSSSVSSPSTELPADGGNYPALAVDLLDSSGAPAIAPDNIVIQLVSSQTNVLSVEQTVTIPQGSIGVLVPVQTSTLPGGANITASSPGLNSGTLLVTTEIPAPTKLQVYLAPSSVLQPETGNFPVLYVQLQDAAGNPASAREATRVVLTSSNSSLFNETMFVTIPQGADYASLSLDPASAGSTTFTASASGLASSTATLKVSAFPFAASLTLSSPAFIYANQTEVAIVKVTLLGQPLSNVTVFWNAYNVFTSHNNETTNSDGIAQTILTPARSGSANVTARASSTIFGKFQVSAAFSVFALPAKPRATLFQDLATYWYIPVAIVVAAVAAGVFLLRQRRRHAKAELEAGFEAVS